MPYTEDHLIEQPATLMNTPHSASSLEQRIPAAFRQLQQAAKVAEAHAQNACDIEFSVQEGRLFVLSVRDARTTSVAKLRIALDLVAEGIIEPTEFLRRLVLEDVKVWLMPSVENLSELRQIGGGVPASAGSATGRIAFSAGRALEFVADSVPVVLVRHEVSPEDLGAIASAQGVLTLRGGVSSHAALVCRQWEKPCVTGYRPSDSGTLEDWDLRSVIQEGGWVTIDGSTGLVFAGKGELKERDWREIPALVALSEIVAWGVRSGRLPCDVIGHVWRMSDFFTLRVPLSSRASSAKKPASRSAYTSFVSPNPNSIRQVRDRLTLLASDEGGNYGEIIFSFNDALLRLLAEATGIGNHPLYFRPLWAPEREVEIHDGSGTQFVGFRFFDVNRYVQHLVDIATVEFFIELEIAREGDEWFLDFTNPKGESLVRGAGALLAYRILVNGAEVEHGDLPVLYDALRRREFGWEGFSRYGRVYREVVADLAAWRRGKDLEDPICEMLYTFGLIKNQKLTMAGRSLLGEITQSKEYE